MSTRNLWGQISVPENIKTPLQILKEQASALTEATKGVVEGQVRVVDHPPRQQQFNFALTARAPALNGYEITILTISYNIEMYPLWVDANLVSTLRPCETETDFLEVLSGILSGQEVHRVLSALIVQSNAASK